MKFIIIIKQGADVSSATDRQDKGHMSNDLNLFPCLQLFPVTLFSINFFEMC